MKKIILLGAVLGSSPLIALAAGTNANNLLTIAATLLNKVVPVLIALAVVYFIWGVIQYTISTDEEAKKGARGKIIQGLIGLFIIIAFWGILALVENTTGIGSVQLKKSAIPCVPNASIGVDCVNTSGTSY